MPIFQSLAFVVDLPDCRTWVGVGKSGSGPARSALAAFREYGQAEDAANDDAGWEGPKARGPWLAYLTSPTCLAVEIVACVAREHAASHGIQAQNCWMPDVPCHSRLLLHNPETADRHHMPDAVVC